MNKKSKILLIVGFMLLVVLSPMVLVLPSFSEYFDFSKTGQIGDTIGGITAPFINLLGAVLVYLSFSEQLKANDDQKSALLNEITRNTNEKIFNSIIHDIDNLREDINEFKIIGVESNETGSNAIFQFKNLVNRLSHKTSLEKSEIIQTLENIGFLIKFSKDTLNRIDKSV